MALTFRRRSVPVKGASSLSSNGKGGNSNKSDKHPNQYANKHKSPEVTASFLSSLTFEWFSEFIQLNKDGVSVDSLWDLKDEDCSLTQSEAFANRLLNESGPAKPTQKTAARCGSVQRALIAAYRRSYIHCLIWKTILCLSELMGPLLLREILHSLNNDEPMWISVAFCVFLLIAHVSDAFIVAIYDHRTFSLGMRIQAAINDAIFRKSLVLSNDARQKRPVGEIVNYVIADARKLQEIPRILNSILLSPVQVSLSLILIYRDLGTSVFAGLVGLLLLIPVGNKMNRAQKATQASLMKVKDQRLKTMSELLNGIKSVKLYAWELGFKRLIDATRSIELENIWKLSIINGTMDSMWSVAPYLMSVLTFGAFILLNPNERLSAEKAFVCVALCKALQRPLTRLPSDILTIIQISVSMRRLDSFIASDELCNYVTHSENDQSVVDLKNCNFSWDNSGNCLSNISLSIKRGEFVGIVGRIGQGKSSLLSAIMGNMNLISGTVNVAGKVAYVPQQAWLRNATVRSNILFGKPYNEERYWDVVSRCALVEDFNELPAGDETEIGLRGINLSGGQKQRISIARAIYADADVYLFDDPLSAVDALVSAHIFNQVMSSNGLLRNKTRVLVTHAAPFVNKLDRIIVLEEGKISAVGHYQQLLNKIELRALLTQVSQNEAAKSSDETSLSTKQKQIESSTVEVKDVQGKLTDEATSSTHKVKWDVYYEYFGYFGVVNSLAIVFFTAASIGTQLASTVWLAKWASDKNLESNLSHFIIYGLLGLAQSLLILGGVVFRVVCSRKASTHLHEDLLSSVLHSAMSFFDTTPVGRTLGRFSSDINVVDSYLCHTASYWLFHLLSLISIVVVICYNVPLFVVAIVPLGAVFIFFKEQYISTMRHIGRLEAQSRSPIISHFSETLYGIDLIRSFGVQNAFLDEYHKRLDTNHKCFYLRVCANRWLAIRLQACATGLVFFSALLTVTLRKSFDSGTAGLCLTYALASAHALNCCIKASCALECDLIAAERVLEYARLDSEAPWRKNSPDIDWPSNGTIEFRKYSTRYRPGLPLVVQSLNFSIGAGEMVGICGRTGAGKSSLTMSLFRLLDAAEGAICIDGIRIDSIGSHDLREKLTVIPQDPVLFAGTLRFNLDPLSTYSDAELRNALQHSRMWSFVEQQERGVDMLISEGGGNLSVGQRQLICLARALLRKSRILILDEATASIDIETDGFIQHTIRQEFRNSTILTVAHRINTIIDYDRILVLEAGKVKEFGQPKLLLADETSLFSKLAQNSNH